MVRSTSSLHFIKTKSYKKLFYSIMTFILGLVLNRVIMIFCIFAQNTGSLLW